MTEDGILVLSSQASRSQLENKQAVVRKLELLLTKAFTETKTRKASQPSKIAKRARLKEKKIRSEKKDWRRKKFDE